MAVKINDFSGTHRSADFAKVALYRDQSGLNSLWLSDDQREFPRLNIALNNDLAVVHYFPSRRHPGFQSKNNDKERVAANVFFRLEKKGEPWLAPSQATVPAATAFFIAAQFMKSGLISPLTLSSWTEL